MTPPAQEPALVQLLELLKALPRFDKSKPAKALQGDLPAVQEAERLFHTFNSRYQERRIVDDKHGKPKAVMLRKPLLMGLFKLADWKNFQQLLSHSTIGRARKQKANAKHRGKTKRLDPEKWLDECRQKRLARLEAWEAESQPRLLRIMAEAEAMPDPRGLEAKRLRCQVLNELEARYVDRDRATREYFRFCYRVLLGMFTQSPTTSLRGQLEKLAHELWENPEATLKEDLAKRLPPIAPDWAAMDQVLTANGESS